MNYEDRYPFIRLRKFILKMRILTKLAALKIVKNKVFEYTAIVVIIANSIELSL
jgi:hypothetical protein